MFIKCVCIYTIVELIWHINCKASLIKEKCSVRPKNDQYILLYMLYVQHLQIRKVDSKIVMYFLKALRSFYVVLAI